MTDRMMTGCIATLCLMCAPDGHTPSQRNGLLRIEVSGLWREQEGRSRSPSGLCSQIMDQRSQNGSPNKLLAVALRIGIRVSELRMAVHTWNGS